MSKLLIDDRPVMVLPKLATCIGLNEAVVIQQIHYWLITYKEARSTTSHYHDGRWWVYNTKAEWQENFPWWSESTVWRALTSLRERGLLITTSKYNKKSYDRTLWYTIDYEVLDQIEQTILSKWEDASCQNDKMDHVILTSPIPETTTETTTETKILNAPQRKLPETPECPGDNGDQHVDTYLPDAGTQWEILFGKDGKRRGRSWSIPAEAGGADSLGEALLPIFCQGVDFPAEALKPKERRQWAAELRKVAEGRGATVEQAVAALNAYFDPRGEFNWKVKSVSAPFQTGFQTDWNKLLARAVEGQPLMSSKPTEVRYGGRSDFPD